MFLESMALHFNGVVVVVVVVDVVVLLVVVVGSVEVSVVVDVVCSSVVVELESVSEHSLHSLSDGVVSISSISSVVVSSNGTSHENEQRKSMEVVTTVKKFLSEGRVPAGDQKYSPVLFLFNSFTSTASTPASVANKNMSPLTLDKEGLQDRRIKILLSLNIKKYFTY